MNVLSIGCEWSVGTLTRFNCGCRPAASAPSPPRLPAARENACASPTFLSIGTSPTGGRLLYKPGASGLYSLLAGRRRTPAAGCDVAYCCDDAGNLTGNAAPDGGGDLLSWGRFKNAGKSRSKDQLFHIQKQCYYTIETLTCWMRRRRL